MDDKYQAKKKRQAEEQKLLALFNVSDWRAEYSESELELLNELYFAADCHVNCPTENTLADLSIAIQKVTPIMTEA